ncbi:unnamed protein product [Spodoptera exigua]|uniref:Uncharacterized protein n=1 Tax=Spodoptera exigua TaxID=7107 RepID=A0A835G4X9_SPOEX|nr:hypothetical protein HW555_012562 [Spodoptera exigua]CAH0702117.1 unnamed protein product [Spodoptera exigua]
MSIIAVKGVPQKWSLMNVVKILAKTIAGNFEALNFQNGKGKSAGKNKTCYLRLSEKLDPVRVVEKINSNVFPKQFRPFALIPDHVPDIPLAVKPRKIPTKLRRALLISDEKEPEKVMALTNDEIMMELQCKYPGLNSISKKTNHKLMEELTKKVFERIQTIGERNAEVLESCFKLSQCYRRTHPHFGDFQLVLSTLHPLQDAAGIPRTQLSEKELAELPSHSYMIDNLPFDKVQQACNKYSERIIKKVTEHVKNLKSNVVGTDTEDEVVRKKVREELKKMTPFLPMIVKQVVNKHFIPQKTGYYKLRIYGEPFLPGKETLAPFLRRFQAGRMNRSERMYNLLRFDVPPSHYAAIMAMDGTVLNGAKLVIRPSDLPMYKLSNSILSASLDADVQDEEMKPEQLVEWNEDM